MNSERDDELIERLVDRQVLPGGTYLTFARDTVVTPDGRQHGRDIVIHPGAVTICAIRGDRSVLLVRQYRHPAGEVLLELPAGTLEMLDGGSVEDPLIAAKRELYEETGYHARDWRKLSEFYTAPGFASELMRLYLATDIELAPDYEGPEEDERLHLVEMPFDEAVAAAEDGTIRDAKTILALLAVERLAQRGEVRGL